MRWPATRDGLPMRTWVAVSPSQVRDPAFVDDVGATLARSGASGRQLALEITGDTLAAAPPGVLEALAGARIAMILDHVMWPADAASLPVAMVKLDRVFVAARAGDRSAPVVSPAAELAPGLGLPAVADGIETLDQLAAVIESGFPLAQGSLFSRPQSAAAIEALVLRERPFAALLTPRPAWIDLAPGHEPDVAVDAAVL